MVVFIKLTKVDIIIFSQLAGGAHQQKLEFDLQLKSRQLRLTGTATHQRADAEDSRRAGKDLTAPIDLSDFSVTMQKVIHANMFGSSHALSTISQ